MGRSFDNGKINKLIDAYLANYNIEHGREYLDIHRGWQGLVGINIAAHSKPIDIAHEALVIEVDHPAWMNEVHLRREEILSKLKRMFPELRIRVLHLRLTRESS